MTKADFQISQDRTEKVAISVSIYQKNSEHNISMHWLLDITRYCKQISVHFSYH